MVVVMVIVVMVMIMAVVMMAVIMMMVMTMMAVMVVVMIVVMVLIAFFLSQDLHMHMGSGDPHLFHLFPGNFRIRNADARQFLKKSLLILILQKLQQSSGQHISGSSHSQIKIDRLQMITSFQKKIRNTVSEMLLLSDNTIT